MCDWGVYMIELRVVDIRLIIYRLSALFMVIVFL